MLAIAKRHLTRSAFLGGLHVPSKHAVIDESANRNGRPRLTFLGCLTTNAIHVQHARK